MSFIIRTMNKIPVVMAMLALSLIVRQARADEFGLVEPSIKEFAKSAQAFKAMPRLVAANTTLVLPAVEGMTLTEKQMQKFRELAKYAVTQPGNALYSLIATHEFRLSGRLNSDGSFSVNNFYLVKAARPAFIPGSDRFSIDTNGSVSIDSLVPDYRHSAAEKRAILIEEIAYWMAYKIPGK